MPKSPTRAETVLGERYLLAELLGRGGMGDVYRATDQVLGRDVAIKLLREPSPAPPERDRFTAEAKLLAALNHPGLVTILDAQSDQDSTYLVLELVEGKPLNQLYVQGPLDERRAANIGTQIADALAYVHSQGIVHRDVKPANVLVGDDSRVRLADFGIARIMGDLTRHTATGFTMGTAAYVAPEQVQGQQVTTAADVYSLGLVLLEALTSEVAFTGTASEVALARLSKPPALASALSADWQALLSRMTALEPSARPDASEVRAKLSQIARADPTPDPEGTQPLEQTPTRPITTPIPVTDHSATEAIAATSPERPAPAAPTATQALEQVPATTPAASATLDEVGNAVASAVKTLRQRWMKLSTQGQLAVIAVAIVVLALCIFAVTSWATGSAGSLDAPPDVPGKIGQDLQQLHNAVTR